MAYVDCPNCARRLRVPDSSGPRLRCPSCKQTFERPVPEPAEEPIGVSRSGLQESFTSQAGAEGEALGLSDEDLAGLNHFGVGAGFEEPTGDAEAAAPRAATVDVQPAPPSAADGMMIVTRQDARQQVQIMKTALELAQKLTEDRLAELAHTRRVAVAGWVVSGVLCLAAAMLVWWGTAQSGSLRAEKAQTAALGEQVKRGEGDLRDERQRLSDLGELLDAERGDALTARQKKDELQDQLAQAREGLASAQADARVTSAQLNSAEGQVESLKTRLAEAEEGFANAQAAAIAAQGQAQAAALQLHDAQEQIASLKAKLAETAATPPPSSQPTTQETASTDSTD